MSEEMKPAGDPTVKLFFAQPGEAVTDPRQQAVMICFGALTDLANRLGPMFGTEAVMGALLTSFVHAAHANAVHEDGIKGLVSAIHMLKHPELIIVDKVPGTDKSAGEPAKGSA